MGIKRIFDGYGTLEYTRVFREALSEIQNNGQEVKPRGALTKEISPAMMVVDPLYSIYASPKRNLNFAFLLAENLWYMTGRTDTLMLSYYNSNIKKFSDDNLHDGAYGPKIISQIRYIVDTLKNDPDSRQAIISLWERNPRPSKDMPCTSIFQFLLRDGKLNLYVTMRSNDIVFGSNYDIPSFSLIQIIVASMLSVPTGKLYLTANSLHLYEMYFGLADELLNEQDVTTDYMLFVPGPLSLADHIKQLELLGSFEASLRHFGDHRAGLLPAIHHGLCPFYYQYALMFRMYRAIKDKDDDTKLSMINLLKAMNSPFGFIYSDRYKKIDALQ